MLKTTKHNLSVLDLPSWPFFSADEITKVSGILTSGKVNYWTGEEGKLFEKEFAEIIGVKHAVALMNGTVALEAALSALEIGPGDEVITSCRTFIASASCIVMRGAQPILADIDPDSQNITAQSIRKVITKKTKAIIIVHLAGWPAEMDEIMQLAKEHNLFVIEDCAQSLGAKYNNQMAGSFGDIAAFSFCQDKIMTTGGEGGMIATNNTLLWEKIWALKDHGKSYQAVYQHEHPVGFRWLHESFGTNWRMTEMQAGIGRLQLAKLAAWIHARRHHAAILTQHFKEISAFRIPAPSMHIFHAYYKYYVFIQPKKLKSSWNRDRILTAINTKGIPCFTGICGEIYLEKAFTAKGWGHPERFANAQNLSDTSLMFLVHPTLSEEHLLYMVQIVKEVMEEATVG